MSGAASSNPEPLLERLKRDLADHERRRGGEGPSRYEILAAAGEGATAVVYRARDRQLNRTVALKLLKAPPAPGSVAAERFRREGEAAARLAHPNIVPVFDAGEIDGRPFIVMEYVEGRPLSELLADAGRPLREKVSLLEQAARGAAAAHAVGIVHRDLKPANVLVSPSGIPKIGDFGLVHLESGAAALTRTGAALGTPLYMAPEQVDGAAARVSPRTDVHALGAILYEILGGRPPYPGETLAEVYRRIVGEEPARMPGSPPDLEKVALKALEKEPGRRYPDAAAFADDVARWLRGEPVEAASPSRLRRFCRRHARHGAIAAVASLCLAAGAGAALWLSRPDARDVRLLFNGSDLAGWVPVRGRWDAREGRMVALGLDNGGARIDTFDAFRDYDLDLKVRAPEQRTFIELLVHGGSRAVPFSLQAGVWHDLRLRARGSRIEAWAGESPLPVEAVSADPTASEGALGLWTRGPIEIKDVRLVRVRKADPR